MAVASTLSIPQGCNCRVDTWALAATLLFAAVLFCNPADGLCNMESGLDSFMNGSYASAVLCDDCAQTGQCMCNFITGYNLSFGRKSIEWNITNLGTRPATICTIDLFWPSNNGELKKATLDDSDIYRRATAWSNDSVTISDWDCDIINRTIPRGQTRALKVYFLENVSEPDQFDYKIGIRFCENCSLEFEPTYRVCDISTGNLTLSDENKSARLRIANWGNGPVTVCRILMATPEKHLHLRSVELDQEEIFAGDKAPPEMVIPGHGDLWNETDGRRTIGQGQAKTLQLNFGQGTECCNDSLSNESPLSIESLQVDLCPCSFEEKPEKACGRPGTRCNYEIPQPRERLECWMAGPGSICDNTVGVYIPMVEDMPAPDGYSYTWKIDNGEGTHGANFNLEGCSMCIGEHVLQLTVKDGSQSVCKSHKIVRIAPVPTFTIFAV